MRYVVIAAPGNAAAFSSAMLTSHFVYLVCAAVIVNILAFHITMWPQSIFPFPIIVTICWFIVAWPLRAHFASLFARKVEV